MQTYCILQKYIKTLEKVK